jgi:hypothetical protein
MGSIHQWCLWIDSPVININLNHDISSSARTKIRAELNVLLLERLLLWVKIRCMYMLGLTRVCPGWPGHGSTCRIDRVWPIFYIHRSFEKPGSVQPPGRPTRPVRVLELWLPLLFLVVMIGNYYLEKDINIRGDHFRFGSVFI